jgi:hypothetical protein
MHSDTPKTGVLEAPRWADDQHISSLCTTGHRPLILTGVLLWLVRSQFQNAGNIISDKLKAYIWNQDPTVTKIKIDSVTEWRLQDTQRRPSVMVKRNTLRPNQRSLSIGDKLHGGMIPSPSGAFPVDSGSRYNVLMLGSHTLFAISQNGAEVEELAAEVFYRLVEFGPVIQRDLGFDRFVVPEIGAVHKLEESKEHWVVPIVVAYGYQHAWRLAPEGPPMKTVELNTSG